MDGKSVVTRQEEEEQTHLHSEILLVHSVFFKFNQPSQGCEY